MDRANAMIERYLRCYVTYQQNNWSDLLPFAEVAYNNAIHWSTGATPFQIVTGKEFRAIPELDEPNQDQASPPEWSTRIRTVWPQVKAALSKAVDKYKTQADKKRTSPRPFRVGTRFTFPPNI